MNDADDHIRHTWYVRHAGGITGPFPSGHIQRQVLLGRFRPDDEISHDRRNWVPLSSHPELVPEILKADPSDPLVRDRLAAARRWADDGGVNTSLLSAQTSYDADHPAGLSEDGSAVAHQALEKKLVQTRHDRWRNNIISLLLLSAIGMAVYFYFARTEPVSEAPVDCTLTPGPGVNLSNCFLQGVSYAGKDISGARLINANLTGADLRGTRLNDSDLSYSIVSLATAQGASLQGARLVGADFNAADLRNADLSDADLSYANLYGANIDGTVMVGTRLDQTRWVDGRICHKGSVGECR